MPHICHFSLPSISQKKISLSRRHSRESFTDENLWIRLKRLSVSHFVVHSCAAFGAPKATGCRAAFDSMFDRNVNAKFDTVLFILLLYLPVALYPLSPFIFSPSNRREDKKTWTGSRPRHIAGSINVWTATKYSGSVVCSGLSPSPSSASLTSFFGQSKETKKPFERAIEQMMITTTTHDDYPNILTSFDVRCQGSFILECPFAMRSFH